MAEIWAAVITGVLAIVASVVGVVLSRRAGAKQRPVRPSAEDGTDPTRTGSETGAEEQGAFSALSVVKIVDLGRNHVSRPEQPKGITIWTDYYFLRRESLRGAEASFLYSTSGAISGQSVSHPQQSYWRPIKSDHLRRSYRLTTSLSHLAPGQVARVINRLEYVGAFEGDEREYVETHIDRPTDGLTWIILFSDERPCLSCLGQVRIGRGVWKEAREPGPVILEDGTLVVWTIGEGAEPPAVNSQYSIEWTWAARRA